MRWTQLPKVRLVLTAYFHSTGRPQGDNLRQQNRKCTVVAGQIFVSTADWTRAMGFTRMVNNPEDLQGSLPVLTNIWPATTIRSGVEAFQFSWCFSLHTEDNQEATT